MKTNTPTELEALYNKPSLKIRTVKKPSKKYPYFNPNELITCECEIQFFDTDGGTPRTRLIRYVKGMPSIFVDEWSDEERKKKPEKIKLKYGEYNAPTSDKNLIAYLFYSGQNKANVENKMPNVGVLFEIMDFEKLSKDAVITRKKHVEAENFIYNAPISDLKGIAMALAKNKSEVETIKTQDEWTLRNSMKSLATTKPEVILSGFSSPKLKNKVVVYKALQEGIIHVSPAGNTMYWNQGSEFVTAPAGMEPVDWFVDLAESNEDYKDIMKDVKLAVGDKAKEADQPKVVTLEAQMLERAIKNGKIVKNGNWYMIPGENEEDEPRVKFNGVNKILTAIKDNEDNIVSYIY